MSGAEQPKSKRKRKRKRKKKLGMRKFLLAFLVAVLLIVFFFRADFVNAKVAAHIKQREYDVALEWIGWANRIDPGNAETMFLTARVYRLRGETTKFDEMINSASDAKYNPDRIEREKLMMRAQTGQFNEQQAREFLVKILQSDSLDGDEEEVSEAFVMGFMRNSQFQFAKQMLHVWSDDFPNNPKPLFLLGMIEKESLEYRAAEDFFRKGLAAVPTDPQCAYELGGVLILRRKPVEALGYFKIAEENGRDRVMIRAAKLAQADSYRKIGEGEKARALIDILMEEDPKDEEVILLLAQLESDKNAYEEVVKLLEPVVTDATRNNDLRQVYAVALREVGNALESSRQLAIVREHSSELIRANEIKSKVPLEPNNSHLRYQVGQILLKYGSIEEALMWLSSAHNMDPNHVPTIEALIAYYMEQREDRVVRYYRRRLEAAMRNPTPIPKENETESAKDEKTNAKPAKKETNG